jgi:WD40 repeat protein
MMTPGRMLCLCSFVLLCSLSCIPVSALTAAWNTTLPGSISDLAISDDGSRVIVGTMDGLSAIYDQDGKLLWETHVPGSVLVGCRGNGSAFVLAAQEDIATNKGAVRCYNQSGDEQWYVNTGAVEVLQLPARADVMVIGNSAGETIVLNDQGTEIARFNETPMDSIIADVSVSGDGKVFAYAVYESFPVVRYATIDSGKKYKFKSPFSSTKTGSGSDPVIRQVRLSSDGKFIATAGGEGSQGILTLYARNGTVLWLKKVDAIRDISITKTGSYIFTGTTGGDISCFAQDGNAAWVYPAGAEVTSLSLSPDRGLLAAGDEQGDLFLFNATGDLFRTLLWTGRIHELQNDDISKVRLARNGTALVAAANGNTIFFFKEESKASPEENVVVPTSPIPLSGTPEESTFPFSRLTEIWNAWKNLTAPLWKK